MRIEQSDVLGIADSKPVRVVDREDDRERHIHNRPIMKSEGIEMKRLEELRFSHKPTKWARPAFAEHVNPFEVDPRELDSRQRQGLFRLRVSLRLVNEKLDELAAIGFD